MSARQAFERVIAIVEGITPTDTENGITRDFQHDGSERLSGASRRFWLEIGETANVYPMTTVTQMRLTKCDLVVCYSRKGRDQRLRELAFYDGDDIIQAMKNPAQWARETTPIVSIDAITVAQELTDEALLMRVSFDLRWRE